MGHGAKNYDQSKNCFKKTAEREEIEGPVPVETGVKETTMHYFRCLKKCNICDPGGLQRSPHRHAIKIHMKQDDKGEVKENQSYSNNSVLTVSL